MNLDPDQPFIMGQLVFPDRIGHASSVDGNRFIAIEITTENGEKIHIGIGPEHFSHMAAVAHQFHEEGQNDGSQN
jgi:hypothetical protein